MGGSLNSPRAIGPRREDWMSNDYDGHAAQVRVLLATAMTVLIAWVMYGPSIEGISLRHAERNELFSL